MALTIATGSQHGGGLDRFRGEVREWFATHLDDDLRAVSREPLGPETWARSVEWERRLASGGWIGLAWPAAAGGRGASLDEQLVFAEEYAVSGAPNRAGFFGEQMLGPTLIVHGTDAQRDRFLGPIRRGEEFWCQGYSEPGAGSDLAAVSTSAVRDGDDWVITGQKAWTSLAQYADWVFVLCRTDPTAARHAGLSLLMCPLDQPGVDIRPIRQLTGEADFNEVFFDGARTPVELTIGDPGHGWSVAMALLGFERGTAFLAQQRVFARQLAQVVADAQQRGRSADPVVRQELAGAWAGLELIRLVGRRVLDAHRAGTAPGPAASIGKLLWSQWHQRLGALALAVRGPDGLVIDGRLDDLQHVFLFSRQDTIAAGSSEIQRNIIGERVLGLPRG